MLQFLSLKNNKELHGVSQQCVVLIELGVEPNGQAGDNEPILANISHVS